MKKNDFIKQLNATNPRVTVFDARGSYSYWERGSIKLFFDAARTCWTQIVDLPDAHPYTSSNLAVVITELAKL